MIDSLFGYGQVNRLGVCVRVGIFGKTKANRISEKDPSHWRGAAERISKSTSLGRKLAKAFFYQ